MIDSVTAPAVIVAAAQIQPRFGDVTHNLEQIADTAARAAAAGAVLVVFPELATTGYMFADYDEALSYAEPLPGGPTSEALCVLCARLDIHIVVGMAELDPDTGLLYNSAVLIGPSGHIGTYRKLHLWDRENRVFEPGNLGLPVFDTPLGRLGVLICYDIWFPEAFRSLALDGAQLVCVSTNWVPIPGQPSDAPAIALTLCQAAAHVNSIHIIAADRVGVERGQYFIGQSAIVGPTGRPLGDAASETEPALLLANADLPAGRRLRTWNEFNDPIADRRPEAYHGTGEAEATSLTSP